MSKIIGFIKANLIVVISVLLIFVFIPTGYFFANGWNKKVHDAANAAYNDEKQTLTSNGSITYSLLAVLEGEADLSESRAPNTAVTRFYQARKAEREEQVQEVVERGTAFNQGDHIELVPGILPQAADNKTQKRLGREMAEAIAGTEANPSVYQRKLQRLNAGSPPKADTLAATLSDVKNEQQKIFENSNADGKMTVAQAELLEEKLISHRLGEYIGRSKALTFYCSTDAFVNGDAKPMTTGRSSFGSASKDGFSVIPSEVPPLSTIDEAVVFNWLWDFWVISDVLDAAAMANTSVESGAMAIPSAPIKSIESIRISQIKKVDAEAPSDDASSGGGGRFRSSPGGSNTKDDDEKQATFTGRTGGESNSAFDLRTIEVVVVASSQDLPRFIDAVGKTNYMTVTDVDLEQVDVWSDLEQGFYYGDDHVVRAKLTIESVWLRSWMTPIMPDPIKLALGVPVIAEIPEGADD